MMGDSLGRLVAQGGQKVPCCVVDHAVGRLLERLQKGLSGRDTMFLKQGIGTGSIVGKFIVNHLLELGIFCLEVLDRLLKLGSELLLSKSTSLGMLTIAFTESTDIGH